MDRTPRAQQPSEHRAAPGTKPVGQALRRDHRRGAARVVGAVGCAVVIRFKPIEAIMEICEKDDKNYVKWTPLDWTISKIWPEALGGGSEYLWGYKDAWVIFNRDRIRQAASKYRIPATLLAGVAWAEAGGAPDVQDSITFPVRSLFWSGPGWMDRLSPTKRPSLTSVGSISMQLEVAARELNIKTENMSFADQGRLKMCLEQDAFNLDVVAKHLQGLILHDYPNTDALNLTKEQWIVVGSRYNRGTARPLKDFIASMQAKEGSDSRVYSSYGRALLGRLDRVSRLMVTP